VTISSVTPWRFATLNGKTTLVGTMSGTVTVNGASKPFTSTFDWTVTQAAATCPVLFLVLGPLNLNLLGLHLVTNQIIVNVYADPNGGLLGSLLCGLANLLGPGPTSAILQQLLGAPLTNLLNAILGLL
jgi:hypothetical protein